MNAPLRLLFTRAPAATTWRAGFDLAQAAAALDVPLELGFAGDALELIMPLAADTGVVAGTGVWASLALLGVDQINAPATCRNRFDSERAALAVCWLSADQWQAWLRRAPLQGW
jgi:hypothetical protein